MDIDYNPVDVLVQDNKDGTFFCRYMPKRSVKHTILINYGGVAIPNSPYRVLIQDASNPAKVKVYGPAVEHPVKTFQPTYFIVDCSEAGPGDFYAYKAQYADQWLWFRRNNNNNKQLLCILCDELKYKDK